MRIRHLLLQKKFIAGSFIFSFFYYQISKCRAFLHKLFIGKYIVLEGNAKIGIHHKTQIKLVNSKIFVHSGNLRVGISFGYFDRATIPSSLLACRINMLNSELHIFGDVSLYPGSCIDIENGKVSIGGNTILNPNTRIMCKKEVEIGSDCLFAVDVIIRDDDGHAIGTDGQPPVYRIAPVKIGNKCWIGQGASVLKGVHIADGCIVAAGAVVSKDVAASTLVGGIPAQQIYQNVSWNP